MKKMLVIMSAALLVLSACESDAQPSAQAVVYTKISDCKETVENVNAAFSILQCPNVGSYALSISRQSPIYFTVQLKKGDTILSSDFEGLTGELPLESGKALEWHLENGEPRFLIFRLGWGAEAEPFNTMQHLVLNLVGDQAICVLATVDVKENGDANQKVRDLLKNRFKNISACASAVEKY